jgi:DNA-binding transcriptional MerR regulator
MATLLTIGEFSRMTHLSVKALRHYHDVGILEPAAIDTFTGYRSYDASQVVPAQVIRRLRDLGMPLESIKSVLTAPDLETRNREIATHLAEMERQLEQTKATVAGLRALLTGPAVRPTIEYRTIPAVTAVAVAQVVGAAELMAWGHDVFRALRAAIADHGLAEAGTPGALYPEDFFELERSEITAFIPVEPRPGSLGPLGGQVRLLEIPAVEAAVAVHEGDLGDSDRTYGAIGSEVAERAIGVDGPIREYYVVGPGEGGDESRRRTEICWPVFLTR